MARGTTLAFDIPVYHKFSLQFRSANAASVHSCCHSNLVHANSSSNKLNPFRSIVQKPDACNRIAYIFNEFYNWFDLFYLLNYTTRSLSVLYIVCQNLHQYKWKWQLAFWLVSICAGGGHSIVPCHCDHTHGLQCT